MAKYLFQASYTAGGVAGLLREGGTGRRDMFAGMFAQLGGTLEAFYYAFGKDDLYMIAELPDDATAAAASLQVSAAGAISMQTTVLVTPETIDEAARRSVSYRAPGA